MEVRVALEAAAMCLHQLVVTAKILVVIQLLLQLVMVVKVVPTHQHVRTLIMALWIHTMILVNCIKKILAGADNTTTMTSTLVRCVVLVEVETKLVAMPPEMMPLALERVEHQQTKALVAATTLTKILVRINVNATGKEKIKSALTMSRTFNLPNQE